MGQKEKKSKKEKKERKSSKKEAKRKLQSEEEDVKNVPKVSEDEQDSSTEVNEDKKRRMDDEAASPTSKKPKKDTPAAVEETHNDSDEDNENDDKEDNENDDKEDKEPTKDTTSDTDPTEKPNFFSTSKTDTFSNLPLSEATQKALSALNFTRMTQIQSQSIPALLTGKDLVGAAKTGSGKTLAFLIPILELLHKTKFGHKNGTGAIVISPTRELSLQTFGVLDELIKAGGHSQTYGLVIGGANRSTEAHKLSKGVNIVIATPGRLLDHLRNTPQFLYRNLVALVMDEADRILEIGFEEDLRAILKLLPKERQTMLFSATQTKKVEDLARVSIKKETAVVVDVPNETNVATAAGLEQGYVTVTSAQRFLLLFTFLKKNRNKKIMVFFSSCNSVKYHSELLNYIDVPVTDIHGRQKQQKRTTTFFSFVKATSGTLLCTDVAARGLDIPQVDWIIQFDPPDDPREYIHRVGRTARGATGKGRALLFLTPEETGFLRYLKKANVALNEYEFPLQKLANVQSQLERVVEKNYYLNKSARDAYRSYLLAYASHSQREIFNVHELDLQGVGRAFGFTTPPRVDIAFSMKGAKGRNKKSHSQERRTNKSSGHAFSASNPYGMKEKGDKRQFTH